MGLLLEYCADTNLKTEQNQIAQQMARLKNHQICVKSIEQHYSWYVCLQLSQVANAELLLNNNYLSSTILKHGFVARKPDRINRD